MSAQAKSVTGAEQMVFFPQDFIHERFDAGGGTLLETPHYRVDAIQRDRAGEVACHLYYAHVIHAIEGEATIVVGGQVVHAREVAPGELRTHRVEKGKRHAVKAGDVLVVREGVPHQFTHVSKPFRYIAVRIDTSAGAGA